MSWEREDIAVMPREVRWMNVLTAFLLWALLCAASFMGIGWVMKHPRFAIERILVEGDTTHHNALTLQANVAGRLQGNFFTIDLAQTRTVFESVPWVRKAVVRREFPNKLRIKLEEHQAVALWGADTESRLVNSFGEVFEANAGEISAQIDELPRWVGADSQSPMLFAMQSKLDEALKDTDSVVIFLELTPRNSWRATLDGGAVLELGRGTVSEVFARTQNFVATHRQVLTSYQRAGLERVESVDLRYGTGYAIRMRGVTTSGTDLPERKS
jgi:cell division protein FtsQ